MCARITITTTGTEIADLFGLSYDMSNPKPLSRARYNVAPSQAIPVMRIANGTKELADLRWGLIPYWNTNPKHTGFVNARAETAPKKPAFRDPFRWRRCLVPADGFFEWETVGKKKRPYLFRKAGGGMFVYAGVWDRWVSPAGPMDTVAVLTVPANELVKPFHERMPAIVSEGRFAAWLDPKETRAEKLLPLLEAYPVERMEKWPVSDRVNSATEDDPELLVAVPERPKPKWTQLTLFDVA
ncbi:MAG: SOS response-associated peptidase [Planctomycetia bacterium]|nr:SOS response-associated peptidase [Planctomycetia bacterium]